MNTRAHNVWLAGGLATALLLIWFVTASDATTTPVTRSDPDALKLLNDAQPAARDTPFTGRQFITAWSRTGTSATALVQVEHEPGVGTSLAVSPTTADQGGGTVFEADNATASNSGLNGYTPQMLEMLTRNYSVTRAGEDTTCGRTTDVVEARRADGSAVGKFWIDRATGLMLRRELLDQHGHAVAITVFYSIRFHRPKIDERVRLTAASQPWGRDLSRTEIAALRKDGWKIPDRLPGNLTLYDARRSNAGGALHLGYTDGLSVVSVFAQRGRLDEASMARWDKKNNGDRTVYVRDSVQQRVVWASRGFVYTVVADAPPAVVETAVAALPHGEPGLMSRLGRGMSRMTAWVNPFA